MEKQVAELGYAHFIGTITTTALVKLLLKKGIITQEELAEEFEKTKAESHANNTELLERIKNASK